MAKLPLAFHPDARGELMEALDRYYERSPDAARAFESEIERACTTIQDSPETWSIYLRGTRRYLLSRFPYLLVYLVSDDAIQIVAVAHGHRKPGYWADRLT
jgi:plasmid stabilization system protein ParE